MHTEVIAYSVRFQVLGTGYLPMSFLSGRFQKPPKQYMTSYTYLQTTTFIKFN